MRKKSSSFVIYKVLVRYYNFIVNSLYECCKESLILYQTSVCERQECLNDKKYFGVLRFNGSLRVIPVVALRILVS